MTEVPPLSLAAQLTGHVLAGRYRLDRLIAAGGMAHVWEATDLILDRTVAVKILHHHLSADAVFVERFRNEAVASARVVHPAIVSMYDTIDTDGLDALVMQYVPGQTLRQRLDEQGRLPVEVIAPIALTVADALEAAHRQGIIHRDIKPANLLLGPHDQILIADFGIAKASTSPDLTATGTLMGTARYLAPEQVRGDAADARTDVYALTAVLYEALSGRPPFDGPNDMAMALARLQRDPVPIDKLCPDLPGPLVRVIGRGLARDPADRFATAEDFRLALSAALRAPTDEHADQPTLVLAANHAPSFTESERTWLVPTVLVLIIAMALAVAGVLLGQTTTGARLYDRVRDAIGAAEATDSGVPSASSAPDVSADVRFTASRSFDPQGTGSPPSEHEELVPLASDGNLDTEWTTESYSSPAFGNLKSGVGLILALDRVATVEAIELASTHQQWTVEVYVRTGDADALADWGPARADGTIDGTATLGLEPTSGDHVLVWITGLDPRRVPHRVGLAEVAISAS